MSRLLNGKAGVSANMALTLKDIGRGTAEQWMWLQAGDEPALARHWPDAPDVVRGPRPCLGGEIRPVSGIWPERRAPPPGV
ncbi:MAG: hypothetical protein OXE86_11895 [Alphaproteobacteria bacterium]|nr:hypothetical protein [Alphaproteobacteria bacterium]